MLLTEKLTNIPWEKHNFLGGGKCLAIWLQFRALRENNKLNYIRWGQDFAYCRNILGVR